MNEKQEVAQAAPASDIARGTKPWRALKPDAQAFDEVRIVTEPRFKESELSGSEWRISARVQLLRKGRVVAERTCGNVESAAMILPGFMLTARDDGKGYFAGEGDYCDQEGCAETATVAYRVKKRFARDNPHIWNEEYDRVTLRKFCNRHKRRGDASFDDSDKNYELWPAEMPA